MFCIGFQELQGAVVKFNNYICKKEGATECSAINQDDLESLALGMWIFLLVFNLRLGLKLL